MFDLSTLQGEESSYIGDYIDNTKDTIFLQGLSDLDQRPLSSIDQKLIDIGSYLSEFRDEQKVHCLKVFVECMDFVTWIRSCTNSMGLMESKEHKLNVITGKVNPLYVKIINALVVLERENFLIHCLTKPWTTIECLISMKSRCLPVALRLIKCIRSFTEASKLYVDCQCQQQPADHLPLA